MARAVRGLLPLILFFVGGMVAAAPAGAPPKPVVLVESGAASPQPSPSERTDFCEGARLALRYPDGRRVVVAENFQSACEPDVSFDGRKILFAGKPDRESLWNIFEYEIGSGAIRQITKDVGNCRTPVYLSTYYIITANEPWLQILFVSDAAGEFNEKGTGRALNLYSSQLDGSEVKRITFNPSSDRDPFLCWDGRVVFSSLRDGVPGPDSGQAKIFNMNVDGTDLAAFVGSQGAPFQRMPAVTTSDLAVFVESDLETDQGGTLGAVTLRRPAHTYRQLTEKADGTFYSPSPLPDGSLLVSRRAPDPSARFELVRLDPAKGEQIPWLSEPGVDLLHARIVEARPQPDGRSSVVNDNHPFAQFYTLNIGVNDLQEGGLLRKIARRLRVLEGLPRHSEARVDEESLPRLLPKRILGEVPVEADGSAFFEVPANTPVQLQLIDGNGMAVRSCGWIWARNKEPRGCIGCHEDGELVPENSLVEAVRKAPVSLTAPAHLRRHVDFDRDVLPLVAKGCATASCHNGQASGPDLRPQEGSSADAYSRRVYTLLMGSSDATKGASAGKWIDPGRARTSPLIWHVLGRNTSLPWDGESAQRAAIPAAGDRPLVGPSMSRVLIEWIDTGAHGGSQVGEAVMRDLKTVSGGNQ